MAGPRDPKFIISEIDGVEEPDFLEYEPQAEDIAFDNTGTDFAADTVQDALVEAGASASPGFNFGRSANVNSGTWLQVTGGVPSNRAGITVALSNAEVKEIYVANQNINTFDITIYEHEGDEVNLTSLGTVSITSSRSASFSVSYSVTTGRQLAVRLTSGSAKNINVGLQISGSI